MAVPYDMLLHPELLTNEQLIYVIHGRHLRIPDIENMPRDNLLEIFRHYCLPYGQRKSRETCRGKVSNRTRHISPDTVPNLDVIQNVPNRKLLLSMNCERLKPPPDLLSGHMKRIKLETKLVQMNDNNNIVFKRKMPVDSAAQMTDSPAPKKERKPITWP